MSSPRPVGFDPVDTSFDPREHSAKDDVESPSLTSGNALARFEFEPGRSKDGTKVLMVEWEEDSTTASSTTTTTPTTAASAGEEWEISWEGKRTVLPAQDLATSELNRLYFLLGPGVAVPTKIRLQKGPLTWYTSPLPAIFPPELGASARQAGKKGVLHTIWAKKRLQVLQTEIEQEDVEGIGFEMAVAEKEWIEQNFGVAARPTGLAISTATRDGLGLGSPTSPRSPGGGRLMDKLKGLKIGTSGQELSGKKEDSFPAQHNPLSPEGSDVAVGSFGSFAMLKGAPPPASLAAKPPQPPPPQQQQQQQQQQQPKKFISQRPPESFAAQQRQQAGTGSGGMGSLNALASNPGAADPSEQPANASAAAGRAQPFRAPEDDSEDDAGLFALPMSPRSPEMAKSPFSFAAGDTRRYEGVSLGERVVGL